MLVTKLARKQKLETLYQVCVFQADWKTKMFTLTSHLLWHFWLLLCNRWQNLMSLDRKQALNILYQFCVFWTKGKIVDYYPGLWLAETFLTAALQLLSRIRQNRQQEVIVLYQVYVLRTDTQTKMAALVNVELRHFRLLLCNPQTEFDEIWQEVSTKCPLPSLCFSANT